MTQAELIARLHRRVYCALYRWYHWIMIWPCLWIGTWFYSDENWFSDRSAIHWLKSRPYLNPGHEWEDLE